MWQGGSVVQSVAVSNATKKVTGGSSSGLRYDLQMFAGKGGSAQAESFLPNGSRIKWGKEHGSNNVRHNNAIEFELDFAEQKGAIEIKKNRYQVDIDGNVVKANRQRKPDAAYTLNGKRININYVSNYELNNTKELNREL